MVSYMKNTPGHPTNGFYTKDDTVEDSTGVTWTCKITGLARDDFDSQWLAS